MLLSNSKVDTQNLINALKSVEKYMPQDNMATRSCPPFNEGNLRQEQNDSIININGIATFPWPISKSFQKDMTQ
jgi:hypothetical protein